MRQHKQEILEKVLEDLSSCGLDTHVDQIQHLADGGMSHIYRARQPSLDRYIVIKQLKRSFREDPELVNRFRREAKCLATVLHQNVAHVYGFVESTADMYILMEYISGVDLSTVLKKIGALPPEVAAAITLGLARGLHCLHARQLIHRDVKPSNIRLTTRGEVKLMDLGIVLDVAESSLTRPGILMGSPSYLTPEQILGDGVSARSDVFQLGICLYEMLCGSRPFQDNGQQTVFHRIREAEYTSLRKMNRSIPRDLERIVDRCLQKSPDARFSDVQKVIRALEVYLGPLATAHTQDVILKFLDHEALVTPTVPITHIEEMRPRQTWWTWIGVSVLCVGSMLLGLFFSKFKKEAPATPPQYSRPHDLR
ncbi:MAG: serine/threonine protein kinase [Bdellovibrionales bacterium]|nr:serine/threonine protein kinase [Bdellovibrionales bacterium]